METRFDRDAAQGQATLCTFCNEYGSADETARRMLLSVLPEPLWPGLVEKGVIQITGKRGIYTISRHSQTEIREVTTGKCVGHACLQLSLPAPDYDRMLVEYLLLKNDEDFYWKTANIIGCSDVAVLFVAFFDLLLILHLLLALAE